MKRIIILGAVVVLVVALWSAAWLWGAGQIAAYEKQLASADGEASPKLTCGSFAVGGYPFGFDVTCASLTVAYQDTTVTAAGLKASAEVYNPFFVKLSAKSPISIADDFTGSRSRVDFGAAEASARLDGWRIARVSVVADDLKWNDTVVGDRLIATAGHAEAHLIDVPDRHDAKAGLATLDEYGLVDKLNVPGLSIAAGKATFEGEISNLSDDVRTYGDPDVPVRWQKANGMFTLRGLKGEDGDRNFNATGNLSLDSQGRVQGQIKLNSKGVVEAIGPMIPDLYRGLITGVQAADGSYSQTVNIAAGTAFVGLVPAAVIPPLF
jgi:hypothetical protein